MKYDVSSPMPLWYAVAQLVEALRYKPEGGGFDARWCHWNFSLTQSFRPHCGPGVDSASNRKEYQEYFLGGKGGRCLGLTALPCPCADVLKYGSLNLLEPSGPVQACNGFSFTFITNAIRHTTGLCFWPIGTCTTVFSKKIRTLKGTRRA